MGIAYNTSVVRNGLVLHLDAANVKSYPGSGTTWTDLSGNGNNGTLVNGVGYSAANKGSLTFDGVNDFVSGSISSISSWTCSIWYTSNNISGALVYYPFSIATNSGIGFGGTFNSSTINKWYFFDSVTSFSVAGINVNQWYNIVVTKSETTYNFYTNGNVSLSNQTGVNLSISSYNLGRRIGTDPWYANGSISNANIYNRALTAAEISQNFEALRGRYGI
jgi:hypothetical protein